MSTTVHPGPSLAMRRPSQMLMHTPPALIEPSLEDVLEAIRNAADLPQAAQWVCSLRQIAKARNCPLSLMPARWTALRLPIGRLHHGLLGMSAKTLANHRSNL